MAGIWLTNVNELRKHQWSNSYLWDIRFPQGPEKFKTWFPATSVEENIYTVDTAPFETPLTTFELPKSSSAFTLSINFIDTVLLDIENWIDHWVNEGIFNGSKSNSYVSCLADAVKEVNIMKLTSMNEQVAFSSYWVYPKGALNFSGTSDNAPHSSGLEFMIAGTIKREYYGKSKTNLP